MMRASSLCNTEPVTPTRVDAEGSYRAASAASPLPFDASAPPPHRPSPPLSGRPGCSMFPKTMSNPRMTVGRDGDGLHHGESFCSAETAVAGGGCDRKTSGRGAEGSAKRGSKNSISNSDAWKPAKKSVRFPTEEATATVHPLRSVPPASLMSDTERGAIWYAPVDFDAFKRDAARDAGVKIVRYRSPGSKTAGGSGHFVMLGDFDAGNREDGPGREVRYNQNEYADDEEGCNRHASCGGGGEGAAKGASCKRGLGYHFSRTRKRSRAVVRSAVLAWQTTLLSSPQSNAETDPMPSTAPSALSAFASRLPLSEADRRSMMLAIVSSKASRLSRAEAHWRGDVDYRVAYPERQQCRGRGGPARGGMAPVSPCAVVPLAARSAPLAALARSGREYDPGAERKRSRGRESCGSSAAPERYYRDRYDSDGASPGCYYNDRGGASSYESDGRNNKRQRLAGGDVAEPRCSPSSPSPSHGSLSPATIGYLVSGILQAEV